MDWNIHSLIDAHALLSPSKHHWLRYSDDKFKEYLQTSAAAAKGVRLHALAKECIDLRVTLPKKKAALNQFVNDGIGFRMRTEQVLYYSPICFGTTDAISFRDNLLRIHDLKTGKSLASMEQLNIYAALFCLEYRVPYKKLRFELRIYQGRDIIIDTPTPNDIYQVMARIEELNELAKQSFASE